MRYKRKSVDQKRVEAKIQKRHKREEDSLKNYAARLLNNKLYARRKRELESLEERETRLEADRTRKRKIRNLETPQEKAERRSKQRSHQRQLRELETGDEREIRLINQRIRQKESRDRKKVCSEHFKRDDFIIGIGNKKLKRDAVPNVFSCKKKLESTNFHFVHFDSHPSTINDIEEDQCLTIPAEENPFLDISDIVVTFDESTKSNDPILEIPTAPNVMNQENQCLTIPVDENPILETSDEDNSLEEEDSLDNHDSILGISATTVICDKDIKRARLDTEEEKIT